MDHPVILGVSPGAKFIGIAILKDGEIIEARIKSFKEKWSLKKLETIGIYIQGLLERHLVKVISIKIPPGTYVTEQVRAIIETIRKIAQTFLCDIKEYLNKEIKKHFFGRHRVNTKDLMDYIVNLTQDFSIESKREQESRSGYYHRMFEAIAVAFYYHAHKN